MPSIRGSASAPPPSRAGCPTPSCTWAASWPPKNPGLLLEAFLRAREDLPAGARLVFVGDGRVRAQLESDAAAAGASDAVSCLGPVTDHDRLGAVYARAIASVSPGEVGLTIVQSLGFGVPMAIARDERHGPEIEAADEGRNCVYFASGSSDALAAALVSLARDRERWLERREGIAADCAARYSADATAAGLFEAVEAASPG